VTKEKTTSAASDQWNRRVGRSQTRTRPGVDTNASLAGPIDGPDLRSGRACGRYGMISCAGFSFLTGLTRSSRFTPRYMAMAAATKIDE